MKNKTLVILIVVGVVVVLAVGYVWFMNRTPAQAPVQTGIATNPATAMPSPVDGMSEYVDQAYGFSFWHPSALKITATATNDAALFPGGVAVQALQVGPLGGTSVIVVNSTSSSITDEPADHASPIDQTEYSYDKSTGEWMVSYPQGTQDGAFVGTSTANVSKTTIGGFVMLPSGRRFDTTIIPLSTTQFLVISDGGGSSFTDQLAVTISTPSSSVNTLTQSTAIQAEATAYAKD